MRQRAGRLLIVALSLMIAAPAVAQDKFPSKPVRILVPYAPGGATDIAARIVAERLKHILGQSFVVENRAGAFGIVAIEEMVRAKPDGYTIMVGNPSTNVITPIVHAKRMKIDYGKSVTVLARLVDLPSLLVVTPKNFPPTTLPELIAYAKANPGKVLYATAGPGSFPHYAMEVLSRGAGIQMTHIPNKGGGSAAMKDVMTGDVHVTTINVATAGPVLSSGTLRPIAVTEEARLPEFPNLPSISEFGLSRPGAGFWHTLFAPSAVPRPVLETLHKAILEAMESPDVVEAFKKNGMRRIPHKTLEEGQAWLQAEFETWRKITNDVPIDIAE